MLRDGVSKYGVYPMTHLLGGDGDVGVADWVTVGALNNFFGEGGGVGGGGRRERERERRRKVRMIAPSLEGVGEEVGGKGGGVGEGVGEGGVSPWELEEDQELYRYAGKKRGGKGGKWGSSQLVVTPNTGW